MEGWFPHDRGEQSCLPIAEAAERDPQLADEIQRTLPSDPVTKLLLTTLWQANVAQRNALPTAGVDAGRNTAPVFGEVSLDILLHGRGTNALLGLPLPDSHAGVSYKTV
jgi:hypothetical protein